jgi:spore maturation protein CgeB
MGTYSDDRQPPLEELILQSARRWPEGKFIVAGPMYPDSLRWPSNVERVVHLSPREHRAFYNAQKFTLNITRSDMRAAGYSPSVRLFEAAACATPIISDEWDGISDLFEIGEEILISDSSGETLHYLRELPDEKRRALGEKARQRVLREHTAAHRAEEMERYLNEARPTSRVMGNFSTLTSAANGKPVPRRATGVKTSGVLRPAYSPENYIYSPAL